MRTVNEGIIPVELFVTALTAVNFGFNKVDMIKILEITNHNGLLIVVHDGLDKYEMDTMSKLWECFEDKYRIEFEVAAYYA